MKMYVSNGYIMGRYQYVTNDLFWLVPSRNHTYGVGWAGRHFFDCQRVMNVEVLPPQMTGQNLANGVATYVLLCCVPSGI